MYLLALALAQRFGQLQKLRCVSTRGYLEILRGAYREQFPISAPPSTALVLTGGLFVRLVRA